jgi:hypothetical protein
VLCNCGGPIQAILWVLSLMPVHPHLTIVRRNTDGDCKRDPMVAPVIDISAALQHKRCPKCAEHARCSTLSQRICPERGVNCGIDRSRLVQEKFHHIEVFVLGCQVERLVPRLVSGLACRAPA